MERSWWWKAALYGVVTVLACCTWFPRWCRGEAARASSRRTSRRDPAGAGPPGRPAPRLRGQRRQGGVGQGRPAVVATRGQAAPGQGRQGRWTSSREGRDDIVFTFKNPADIAKLDNDILKRIPQRARRRSSATPPTGVVRLRLDPDQVAEVQDYALRQGIETIRGRVDKFGVSEPTIIKKGTDIIVELPGLKPADFERIKTIIGRTAQLEFKIVDDGSRVHEEGRRRGRKPKDSPASTSAPTRWNEKTRAAARGHLPEVQEPRRAREVLRRADRRRGGPARPRVRLRGDAGARRRRATRPPKALAHLLPAQARGADRRIPVERRPDLGSADRPPRGLLRVRPPGRGDLRGHDRREHRPQDGHRPRREDQQRARSSRARIGARGRITLGGFGDPVRAAAGGQGPGRRAALGRAAGAAARRSRPRSARRWARTPSTRRSSRCSSAPPPSSCSCSSTTGCRASSRTSRWCSTCSSCWRSWPASRRR